MIGKFKFRTLLVLAAAVLLASYSQDEVMTDTGPDGLVPVTLSAAVGDGVQTRATTTDEGPLDRCLIQILEKEKDEAEWTKGAVRKMDEANETYTLTNIMLNPEKDYTFLFWADGGMSYYTATDLTDVTIASETGEAGIAYQTSEVWDGGDNIEVELTHAVTKVSLQSTTVVPTSKTIDITIPKKYSSFNVLEGKVSGDATTYTHSSPGSGSDGDQFFFYALVEDATQNLTLNAGGGDVDITSVPLGPNKHVHHKCAPRSEQARHLAWRRGWRRMDHGQLHGKRRQKLGQHGNRNHRPGDCQWRHHIHRVFSCSLGGLGS